jgi:hypothetical protein
VPASSASAASISSRNRYGKVVPGDEERAATKLDSYLERTSDGSLG